MVSTAVVHVPLLGLTGYWGQQKGAKRYLPALGHIAAFVLAIVLPNFTLFIFWKSYPEEPEKIQVTADRLEDKNPVIIDDETMWEEEVLEDTYHQCVKYRINKSGAVIGLDMGKWGEDKTEAELIFSNYGEAYQYAQEKEYQIIPSVQMVDQKAKVFEDQFYAAIEEYVQNKAKAVGGGKQEFLEKFLEALIKDKDNSKANLGAIAYMATGLKLGGGELPKLPEGARELQKKYEKDFLDEAIRSKPVGFYTESEELGRIFRQDRFCQGYVETDSAIVMAKVLLLNPALRKEYQAILAINGELTNPAARFSVDDVCDYKGYFNDPGQLTTEMLKSAKWKVLQQRGAGRESIEELIQFFPPATSKENELFAKIYNYSGELPQHNIMNRLIRAIRSGEIDLEPKEDSGWYDYQIYALETLLVPEKGEEGKKLFLSKEYKERLIEAFKTILTKKRELHVKQVKLIIALGATLGPQCVIISPDLSLEPTASYYLRTARGLRFVLNAMTAILTEEAVGEISLENKEELQSVTEKMIRLYYGLYLRVCKDIGLKPKFLKEELTEKQIEQANEEAKVWLNNCSQDKCFENDVRYIVPALSNMNGTRVRYWMTFGVKLLKIKAEYLKPPVVKIVKVWDQRDVEYEQQFGGSQDPCEIEYMYEPEPWHDPCKIECKYEPEEYYMPVEIFAEATGPAEPFTREEFRNLCNQCKNKEEIVRAVEKEATVYELKKIALWGGIGVIAAGGIWLYLIWRGKRRRQGRGP